MKKSPGSKLGSQRIQIFHEKCNMQCIQSIQEVCCCHCVLLVNQKLDLGGVYVPANFFFFWSFQGTPEAYGGAQARGPNGTVAALLHHSSQHHRIQSTSETYTTAHGNAGSLTTEQRQGLDLSPHGCQSNLFLLSYNGNSHSSI